MLSHRNRRLGLKLTVGIGVLGCGTVGASVADRLARSRDAIERASGVRYELRAVAVRDLSKRRPDSLERALFTRDARAVVDDAQVDVVVELVGGTGIAADLVERALDRGRHVVTANKDLLATQRPRLEALGASRGAALRFEAAVGGAVPVVRTITDGLAGDEIQAVAGVLNGTSTAILSWMEQGAGFEEALARAQEMGYAEADPAADVEGGDAAHKLAIVAQLAFGLAVISPRIRRTGIAGVTQRDVARARMLGLGIRLVAATRRVDGAVAAEVAPVLVPRDHEFARANGADNAIQILARDAGRLTLLGPGAGGAATASAVLGDVVEVLRALGARSHLARRGRIGYLEPVLEVAPLFGSLPRIPELPQYPLWEDGVTAGRQRALANA